MPQNAAPPRGWTTAERAAATGLTATRFAWRCLGSPSWPAPQPEPGGLCWLCGGETEGAAWRREDALSPSFTRVQLAAAPHSAIVCEPCAYFASGDAWRQYVAAHPERGLKAGHAVGWRSYSHLFTPDGHETPTRARWRALLLDPPAGPYLAVIALTGQKHLLYRGHVADSRTWIAVLVEEDGLYFPRDLFAQTLSVVEALLTLGCSRDEIANGQYSPGRVKPADVAQWKPLADAAAGVRRAAPAVLSLACWCAHRGERS